MIRLLDEQTIEKIAAGEVIERPISVVKELVENSIDAGAKNISVEIQDGGISLISVSDDGSGIEKDDLDLAFQRHATSKIMNFSDLFKIKSMGFRGEALASIAACSRLTCRTRTKNMDQGLEVIYEDGKKVSSQAVVMSVGCKMIVEDIFSSLPVRKKFLSSPSNEGGRISRLMYNLAVGNADISIRYTRDGRRVFQTSANNTLKDNLLLLFGSSYYDSIISIKCESDNYKVSGLIGNNTYYRGNRQMQHIFLNGRLVEDNSIRDIVEDVYKSIIPNGRFPAYQLFIECDPSNLDINIHPNKKKVSYFNSDELLDLIATEIRNSLFSYSSIPNYKKEDKKQGLFSDLSSEESYKEILRSYSNNLGIYENKGSDKKISSTSEKIENNQLEFITTNPYKENTIKNDDGLNFEFEDLNSDYLTSFKEKSKYISHYEEEQVDTNKNNNEELLPSYEEINFIGIVFKTYIILEDKKNDRLFILDQHAAHERINYEKFLNIFKNAFSASQKTLSSEYIILDDNSRDRLKEAANLLKKIGYSFELKEDGKLYFTEAPSMLKAEEYKRVFLEILDLGQVDFYSMDRVIDTCAMKACKASVKQGDDLDEKEVKALYKNLRKCDYPLTCPHGRPTVILTRKRDLENRFMRNK